MNVIGSLAAAALAFLAAVRVQAADRWISTEKLLAICHVVGGTAMFALSRQESFWPFFAIMLVYQLAYIPTMSLTNAISAIAVVGSILIAGEQRTTFSTVLGTIAVAASMTNIVSGFMITDRMLKMFRERGRK